MLKTMLKKNSQLFAVNVSDLRMAYWILKAADKHQQAVILQISERVLRNEGVLFIQALKAIINLFSTEATIHIDHCRDPELCKQAVDQHVGGVLFDGSSFSFEDNLRLTKDLVDYANRKDVVVEAELAPIPGEEDGHGDDKRSQFVDLAMTQKFVSETGLHLFAPYFGNKHGQYTNDLNTLDFEYLRAVSESIPVPLCIHGGSGMRQESAAKIKAIHFAKINFSTDFKDVLRLNNNNIDPYANSQEVERKVVTAFENIRHIWMT